MLLVVLSLATQAQTELPSKGKLLYKNSLSSEAELGGWIMEGPGRVEYVEGWMIMDSPDESGHHVYWAPVQLPERFMATWEVQNIDTDLGLCIVFFAARGKNGADIFDPTFPKRDGTFKQYTQSKFFNNYHISYYANAKGKKGREVAHLRKNSGFDKVQVGEPGIPITSTEVHKITLVKNGPHIIMLVDEKKIIDWEDDGKTFGPVLADGRIGLRQMKWTRCKYKNLNVWELTKQ
ncbi:MAG: DUF1961 family protein [Bacteroidota bacterium]